MQSIFFRGNKRVGEKRYEYADEISYHTRVGYACEVVFQSRFLFCLFQASQRSSSGSDGSLQLRIADCEGGPFQRLLFLLAMASFQVKRAVVYSLSQGVRREGGGPPQFLDQQNQLCFAESVQEALKGSDTETRELLSRRNRRKKFFPDEG